ncbi:hypothetical protein [Nitratireductor basaltis]|nr:hypothetical protein [Nitratireductor basaltis]
MSEPSFTDAELTRLFGTTAPRPISVRYEIGRLAFDLVEGGISQISFDGVEVVRGITFPVRDRDWGTIAAALGPVEERRDNGRLELSWSARFTNGDAHLDAVLKIEASDSGLRFLSKAKARGDFETNRAGFTILHPVSASGCPVRVEHSDGSSEDTSLPNEIEPWQPFMDIVAITHRQSGVETRCEMAGDVFEMEDQRQWSDASFKTYNRPLALPWPYLIRSEETLSQSIAVSFSGRSNVAATGKRPVLKVAKEAEGRIPQLALVLTSDEAREALDRPEHISAVRPQRLTAHIDAVAGELNLQPFAELAKLLNADVDIEYAVACEGSLAAEFQALAAEVKRVGLFPASLFVCPSVDRQSTPPGSTWPDCPPLEEIYREARDAFPGIVLGGGMLSYFTELNRKRPPLRHLDYVAHGTNPIVHAADDRSVMQTLSALPWIFRSTRAIIGRKAYRLGLSSIPMRQNPYGSRTMNNPSGERICMANEDPRHSAQFAAAYTLGYLAATLPFGIKVWTPSAGAGLRGIAQRDSLTPLGSLLCQLSRLAGRPARTVHTSNADEVASLAVGDMLLIANLTERNLQVDVASGTSLTLAPYAVEQIPFSG